VTLKDTGIGIAREVLPHLFQKWSRAGNANKTNIKGTGLGLFVAKEMINAHNGTIRAESDGEGKGSTFIVELEPFGKI
jgi:signal transduction histidine kinase